MLYLMHISLSKDLGQFAAWKLEDAALLEAELVCTCVCVLLNYFLQHGQLKIRPRWKLSWCVLYFLHLTLSKASTVRVRLAAASNIQLEVELVCDLSYHASLQFTEGQFTCIVCAFVSI